MASTAPDFEVFVQLIDEDEATGDPIYLQRGMLEASHRAILPGLSDCLDPASNARVDCSAPGALMYRPHTNPTLVTPGEVGEYLVEVFPVGHVLRPGHRLVVKINTPPAVDSYYAYVPKRPAGVNTVFHEAGRASRLTLPVVRLDGAVLGPPRACREQEAVRCVPG